MLQMTVEQLYQELGELIKQGHGKKVLVAADDNEGNGYHGIFYSPTAKPKEVKENIEASNGLYDSQETDYRKIVIIG